METSANMRILETRVNRHATQRMMQRNLEIWDLELVLGLGKEVHRSGVTFYFLGKRHLPLGAERALEPLVGTTVVVKNGIVTTVYRNRRALSRIRRKSKRSRPADARRQMWASISAELIPRIHRETVNDLTRRLGCLNGQACVRRKVG